MSAPISTTPYSGASLYVGDLAPDVTEAIIFDTFNAVGPVASVRVCRDAATRRSLGYAYVNFHRVEDADRALETMNFKPIRGKACRIMWSHRDPSLRKSGVGNIFVNHLAPGIDNKTLYDTFSMFGNILSCKVATDKAGKSLGYGFVHYESEDAAQGAIERVNNKVISGLQVSVVAFKSKKERVGPTQKFTNLFIKNLPNDFTDDALKALFSKFGKITSTKLGPSESKGTFWEGKKTRFGFVNFETTAEAQAAIEGMNGFELGESKLLVVQHQKRDVRDRELRRKHEQDRIERQKQYQGVNLYVKNLSDDITSERLKEEFAKFGEISSAKVMPDKVTSKSKGFGFVCFKKSEDASRAVAEMNGRMFEGKPLYVALAQRREQRRAQLEAQYQNRKFQPPQMYPQAPMFYPGMQRPPVMYPQQMVSGRWGLSQGRPQMMQPGVPAARMNYQLMPAMVGTAGRQPRGRRPRQAGKPQQMDPRRGDQQVRYNPGVRNPQALAASQASPAVQPRQPPVQTQQSLVKALAAAPEEQKKQILGERLFPLVQARQPEKAGKITGMLLEMDNAELINLLESSKALEDNIAEALAVLERDDEEESDEEESDEEDEETA